MRRWIQFRALPWREKAMFFQTVLLLPATGAALLLVGFKTWKRILRRFARPATDSPYLSKLERVAQAERAARMVRAVDRGGFLRSSCLERAMVLWCLLRRRGISAELHIGARKQEDRFEAHAWVECEGVVLDNAAEIHRHYSRFDAPIAAAEADRF